MRLNFEVLRVLLQCKQTSKNDISHWPKWSCNCHTYHTGKQECFFANFILSCMFQCHVFLFSSCISFSEAKGSLKWAEKKHFTHRKSFFLNSLVIAWEMTMSMTVYISLLLFPLMTVDVLIIFLNAYSQRWLEQKVHHFIRFRLIASVFHLISSCSFTVR